MKQIKKFIVFFVACLLLVSCSNSNLTVLKGEAEGYGGPISVEVSVDEKGKIKALTITGEKETPEIGGKALPTLQEKIVKAGTVDGVDAVAGATWTSNGVFDAVKNALGVDTGAGDAGQQGGSISASGLKQGIAIVSTPRLGPGKDDKDVPVYSLNEVVAYVITDSNDRIVDLEIDILEIITPNHDGANDNRLAGWPGQSYNADLDADEKVETVLEQTNDSFVEMVSTYRTKRDLGSLYKMNSGTFSQELDIFEKFFIGKTSAEVLEAYNTLFSDVNGRPLNGKSENEKDVEKRAGLNDDQLKEIDALTGATMSFSDAHGDMLGALVAAMGNTKPISSDQQISKVGLGVIATPRLGPGKDDKDVPVYSFNVVVAGTALDKDGKLVATEMDILEIITPNHDGADDNRFAGWPGQSYNADLDADEKVETVFEQTEDSFVELAPKYRSKRVLGNLYKMNSGTFAQELDIYQNWLVGKSSSEIEKSFSELFSDVNGRPLNGKSENEKDVEKRAGLNDDQLKEIDALTGATMSFSDAHGDLLGALLKSMANAK